MRKRAVVTGGAGFLGSHMCERLLFDGYEVLSLDNYATGIADNVRQLSEIGPFRVENFDVTEPLDIPGPVEFVLHMASPASPPDYLQLPVETLKVGSLGTLNALDLAKEKGARFLFTSTSEVYGDPLEHPQKESYWGNVNPVGPRAVYDEAKRFGEALTMAYRSSKGVDTAIVRIFNTYGPRMRGNDGRVIPAFISQALNAEALTVSGDGSQTRSFCYVSDLVDGIARMLHSSHAGPVNIGNPDEISIGEVAELVVELCGSGSEIEYVPRPVEDPERRRPDIARARELLDWSPTVSFEDGLKKTISWFAESL